MMMSLVGYFTCPYIAHRVQNAQGFNDDVRRDDGSCNEAVPAADLCAARMPHQLPPFQAIYTRLIAVQHAVFSAKLFTRFFLVLA